MNGMYGGIGSLGQSFDPATGQVGPTANSPYAGQMVQTAVGPMPYDAIVKQMLSRFQEGKTPALGVKSALQLGLPMDVIRTLPGVDDAAIQQGQNYITSGAFPQTATGTMEDYSLPGGVPYGSDVYNARMATGLDPFGFPQSQVSLLQSQGLYGQGLQYDPYAYSNIPQGLQQQAWWQMGSGNNLMNNQNALNTFTFGNQQQPQQFSFGNQGTQATQAPGFGNFSFNNLQSQVTPQGQGQSQGQTNTNTQWGFNSTPQPQNQQQNQFGFNKTNPGMIRGEI